MLPILLFVHILSNCFFINLKLHWLCFLPNWTHSTVLSKCILFLERNVTVRCDFNTFFKSLITIVLTDDIGLQANLLRKWNTSLKDRNWLTFCKSDKKKTFKYSEIIRRHHLISLWSIFVDFLDFSGLWGRNFGFFNIYKRNYDSVTLVD